MGANGTTIRMCTKYCSSISECTPQWLSIKSYCSYYLDITLMIDSNSTDLDIQFITLNHYV